MASSFQERLKIVADAVESSLVVLLEDQPLKGEITRPDRLLSAMRHAMLGGGKRLRPFLLIESARLFDADGKGALRAASALECVHGYSLVHDDLPAMDDDDIRRGRPTVHKAFDDATAILAGDGLLTLAFDILADEKTHPEAAIRSELVLGLARAAGLGGMVGGQMLDLQAEGNSLADSEIRTLQAMKTGALIRYACEAGAIFGNAAQDDRARIRRFGEIVGLAFQLADDLLDIEADAATLGKTPGKDVEAGKATLVALNGANWTRDQLVELIEEAEDVLAPFGDKATILRDTARFVAERKS